MSEKHLVLFGKLKANGFVYELHESRFSSLNDCVTVVVVCGEADFPLMSGETLLKELRT